MSDQPDYERIAQLERELGIGEPAETPRRPASVCLVKDCDGETTELRSWDGCVIRMHRH